MPRSERLRGLDATRALVVFGLIFFHSALIFDERDDYYVKNPQTADLAPVAALGVVWAMPLLFLTAGIGVWHSLGRRGARSFVRERARRLLVPLVFGTLVLMPVPVWFRLRTDPGYAESYVDFYPRFLRVRLEWTEFPFVVQGAPPDGLFETGQLWFVVLLLAWSLLLLPVFGWLRRRPPEAAGAAAARRPWMVLLPALPLALTSAAFPLEENHAAWSRWAYLLFFFLGFVLASDRRFLAAVQRLAVPVVPLGLAAFVVTFAAVDAADAGGDPFVDHRPLSVAARFLFGMTGWLWLVAIVGLLTRRRGRRRRPAPTPQPARAAPPAAPAVQSAAAVPDEPPPACQADQGQPSPVDPAEPPALRLRLLDQAGEAVLPVYVLHQPVLVAVAFVVVGWALPAPVKYLVIVLATLLAVAAAYLLVRRTRPTRFLFGMRPAALRSTGPAGRRPDGG